MYYILKINLFDYSIIFYNIMILIIFLSSTISDICRGSIVKIYNIFTLFCLS